MLSWEQFQTAYQNASLELKALIDSEKIPDCVDLALQKRNGAHLQTKVLVLVSGQVLGIQTIDQTITALKEVGVVDGLQFIAEIQSCIEATTTATESSKDTLLNREINQAKSDLESLEAVRTMASDMAAIRPGSETVYQSSQADLLHRETPATPPETPRWETEQN